MGYLKKAILGFYYRFAAIRVLKKIRMDCNVPTPWFYWWIQVGIPFAFGKNPELPQYTWEQLEEFCNKKI